MFISEDDAWMHVQGQDEFSGIEKITPPGSNLANVSCAEQGCEIKKSCLLKALRLTCRRRIKRASSEAPEEEKR